MPLTREEVQHIADLCRLAMTEAEVDEMAQQLSDILDQFHILREVDTEGVPPTSHAVSLESVYREDSVSPSSDRDDVMANAPRRHGDQFRVNAVVEE